MTPARQEAERLISLFENIVPTARNWMLDIGELDTATARQCAIIHCEEMLSLLGNADETRYAISHYQSVLNILKEKQ